MILAVTFDLEVARTTHIFHLPSSLLSLNRVGIQYYSETSNKGHSE